MEKTTWDRTEGGLQPTAHQWGAEAFIPAAHRELNPADNYMSPSFPWTSLRMRPQSSQQHNYNLRRHPEPEVLVYKGQNQIML